ncbi:type III secretion system chaperone [Thalassomonas viridans]|uniref:Type III secretion system chaperone n=1 Tax=Thalassomonas viridans TaxID=137584 RepID=A0AAE9Z8V4_9GAMM|nr:type III secretion system chaperone [Thalassomonas viridans]WDE07433.1 type III secretion system chaperone [Thalassomonas viridans]
MDEVTKYTTIMQGVFKLLGLELVDVKPNGAFALNADDGTSIEISYQKETREIVIISYIANVFPGYKYELFEMLLKANFACKDSGFASFGLSPDGQYAVLSNVIPIDSASLAVMDQVLAEIMIISQHWVEKLQHHKWADPHAPTTPENHLSHTHLMA